MQLNYSVVPHQMGHSPRGNQKVDPNHSTRCSWTMNLRCTLDPRKPKEKAAKSRPQSIDVLRDVKTMERERKVMRSVLVPVLHQRLTSTTKAEHDIGRRVVVVVVVVGMVVVVEMVVEMGVEMGVGVVGRAGERIRGKDHNDHGQHYATKLRYFAQIACQQGCRYIADVGPESQN